MVKVLTTIELPPDVYKRLERVAQVNRQPVNALAAQVLAAHLPSADDELPAEFENALKELETFDNDALWEVMVDILPTVRQRKLHRLLEKNSEGTLTAKDRAELDAFQREANLLMLRKAHAAVLLKQRGVKIPTVEELGELQRQKRKQR
jgi:predicted transcriptional regulator